uniref:NAC domain-containing protein n=2 Tax=Oryza brachyantha TaxID=4533 RepID=J3L2U3_ORYBR
MAASSSSSRPDEEEPSGDFWSHPTDQELVTKYLRRHVESGKNLWRFVHEADVYAADPEDLTTKYAPAVAGDGSAAWYFFTTVRPKSEGGQRRARAVGDDGCWHSEAGAKDVVLGVPSPRPIGRRQAFSFVTKRDGQRVRTGWIMVEIGLGYAQQDVSSNELVLCKVYRSPRARPAATKSKTADEPASDDVKPAVAA